MPHGGGGGSAGGGFHGGSGSSSGGRGISHTYYPGSKRYRYMKSNGDYDYVYMRNVPGKSELRTSIITFVSVIGLMLFVTVMMLAEGNSSPKKIKGSYESPDTHIEGYSYLDNTEELEKNLEEFEDLTGICPIVYAVYNDDWDDYKDLEDYAYDLYVDNYSDEEHFVIVYSIDEDDAGDWYWETMVGDDTDDILTEGRLKTFGKALQKRLESGTEPGKAISETIEDSFDYIMASPAELGEMRAPTVMMSFMIIFLVIMMVIAIKQYSRKYERVDSEGNLIDDDAEEIKEFAPLSKADPKSMQTIKKLPFLIAILVFVPVILVGVNLLRTAVDSMNEGAESGYASLGFALVWIVISTIALISMITRYVKLNKKLSEDPEVTKAKAESLRNSQREGAPSVSPYPAPEAMDNPPEEKMNAFEKSQVYDESLIDAALNRESHVDYDDEDYNRMKKDGFE